MIVLRPWTPPRCPRCGTRPIVAELVDEDARTPVGVYCQGCALVVLHEATAEAVQQARVPGPLLAHGGARGPSMFRAASEPLRRWRCSR